jgi:hypothetical protein
MISLLKGNETSKNEQDRGGKIVIYLKMRLELDPTALLDT